jgi:hypothetical protein
MGTWGPGNFDNDNAGDLSCDVSKFVLKELFDLVYVEDLDIVMGVLAIQLALQKHCGAPAMEADRVGQIRDQVLKVYDDQIDGLKPKPEYKAARRKAIVETFAELVSLAEGR